MLLVIAVWQGPYGLSAIMLIWLTILSIYPLSTFIWSTIQVHRLAQKAKQAHLDVVNGLVQANLREISEHNTIDAYQKLEKAMGIQVQVQKTQEWPLNIPDTITFLITVMTAVVQTTISLTTAFKP